MPWPRETALRPNDSNRLRLDGLSLQFSTPPECLDYEGVDGDRGYRGQRALSAHVRGKLLVSTPDVSLGPLTAHRPSIGLSVTASGHVPPAALYDQTVREMQARAVGGASAEAVRIIAALRGLSQPIVQSQSLSNRPANLSGRVDPLIREISNGTVPSLEALRNGPLGSTVDAQLPNLRDSPLGSGVEAQLPGLGERAEQVLRDRWNGQLPSWEALRDLPWDSLVNALKDELGDLPIGWEDVMGALRPEGYSRRVGVPALKLPTQVVDVLATFRATAIADPVEVDLSLGAGLLSVTPYMQKSVDAAVAEANRKWGWANLRFEQEQPRRRTLSYDVSGEVAFRKRLGSVVVSTQIGGRTPVAGEGIRTLSAGWDVQVQPRMRWQIQPLFGLAASASHYSVDPVLAGLPGIPCDGWGQSTTLTAGLQLGMPGLRLGFQRVSNYQNTGRQLWSLSLGWWH